MTSVAPLVEALRAELDSEVTSATVLHGGDVARSFRLDLADGRRVFAKTHPSPPPGFFTREAVDLAWLREAGAVHVPEVLSVSDDEPTFLVLSWVEEGSPSPGTEPSLGKALAALHRSGAACFGRLDRRTTGSRGLPNEPCGSWAEHFATQRLLPLADMAGAARALPEGAVQAMRRLADGLDRIAPPVEEPSRLHGDLWAGNRLVDVEGRSWLIDPASFGGHREHDLAMMRLFGGFGAECFAAYEDAFPLATGWDERIALHQIPPLVIHAIKFGGGYVQAAERAIATYA